ncbi:MAG: transglutaminase family protein, partial [Mobilitalea sp.]
LLMMRPLSGPAQDVISSTVETSQPTPIFESTDLYGNSCQRLIIQPGESTITATCIADVSDFIDVAPEADFVPVDRLPDSVMHYLLPSRYCQSDTMLDLANEIIAQAAPGYGQVEAIRAWIQQNVEYQYGTSVATTSAADTAKSRTGVCRDFAHLGIALCRSIRIPARMVSGYLYQLDPMDLHVWFEAYVGGRWYTFDATQQEPRGNRIVVAYGRDAADVAFMSEYGPVTVKEMNVWVNA